MLRSLQTLAPVFVTAVLWLGASAPALADLIEEPPTQEEKSEKSKKGGKDEAKGGGCSVEQPNLGLAAFAGLVLVISATTLRRRPR